MSTNEIARCHGDDGDNAVGNEDQEIPACQSCRKRKLKCSRESPSCSQCSRLSIECNYDRRKQKPGLKSGAVDGLNRRLGVYKSLEGGPENTKFDFFTEILERILLDQDGNQKPLSQVGGSKGCVYHASLLVSQELGRINSSSDRSLPNCVQGSEHSRSPCNDQMCIASSSTTLPCDAETHRRKRQRTENGFPAQSPGHEEVESAIESLPPMRVLQRLVDKFCKILHPWIPFLHLERFRDQLHDFSHQTRLAVILHAVVATTFKHMEEEEAEMSRDEMVKASRHSRNIVILTSFDDLSIENIQALIIIAFDAIGSGQISKAWPIVGSLSRTIEYLGLTVEPDDAQHRLSLSSPLRLLRRPSDWTEAEDQRRIFWNVFLLDRFCSVTTGWNTSITADDVHRRLPCDGGLWHRQEAVVTPFFGIWRKSDSRIGQSIAFMPAQYASPEQICEHEGPNGHPDGGTVDVSKLGAFAYCIEATESLSQVTSFFLQQKVNLQDRHEMSCWLTRFKELDLRLVHWKLFLPQKWKDSNISRDESVKYDPNLTLAHVTHNTSMILLHQHIAYPLEGWGEVVKLPSACSAETCLQAGLETASICEKYLTYTKGIVSSQFCFCAFVAARILLVHWRFYNTELLKEFHDLVRSLQLMSKAWCGYYDEKFHNLQNKTRVHQPDLAAGYAQHLLDLLEMCQRTPNVYIDANFGGLLPPLLGKAVPISPTQPAVSHSTRMNRAGSHSTSYPSNKPQSSDLSAKYPSAQGYYNEVDLSRSIDDSRQYNLSTVWPVSNTIISDGANNANTDASIASTHLMNGEDELAAMSRILLGQQFSDMDRVITLQDTDFALGLEHWGAFS